MSPASGQNYYASAGYPMDGISGDRVSLSPNMQARGFRQERIQTSHEGWFGAGGGTRRFLEQRGFTWRARHDGV